MPCAAKTCLLKEPIRKKGNFQICILSMVYLTYIGWPFKVKRFWWSMLPKVPHTRSKKVWPWKVILCKLNKLSPKCKFENCNYKCWPLLRSLLSYQKKDWRTGPHKSFSCYDTDYTFVIRSWLHTKRRIGKAPLHQSFFWYDNDKDFAASDSFMYNWLGDFWLRNIKFSIKSLIEPTNRITSSLGHGFQTCNFWHFFTCVNV